MGTFFLFVRRCIHNGSIEPIIVVIHLLRAPLYDANDMHLVPPLTGPPSIENEQREPWCGKREETYEYPPSFPGQRTCQAGNSRTGDITWKEGNQR